VADVRGGAGGPDTVPPLTHPNGEFDWTAQWYAFKMMQEHDRYELDLTRFFIVRHLDYGRSFEFYVPVK
jgi:hypothetical protein